MTKSIKLLALLLAFAGLCLADGFTDDNKTPHEPFVSEKGELFRFSRSALKSPKQVKYQQEQQQQAEIDQLTRVKQEQQVDLSGQNVQQVTGANELPMFGGEISKTRGSQVIVDPDGQQQQQLQNQQQQQEQQNLSSSYSSSTSSSASKKSSLAKTITTTTTTTTTTQNNQDKPQVSQIKEIHVHTVPLSEAVHYANYIVVPNSKPAHLEEASSSSSSSTSSSQKSSFSSTSTTSETEQVAIAPSPSVIVNPAPAAVAPDCVLSRVIVHRPVASQLVVQVPSEVQVSRSSSSHSSKIVSQTVAAEPAHTVYRSYFVPQPAHIVSARVVASPVVPTNDGVQEEHHSSEQHSSRRESHGLGHSLSSSSSSSSSSRSSKSTSSTTTASQQMAALVAPPPPAVRTVIVHQPVAAPIVAVKSAPIVHVSSGRSNDVSVDVNHHQSGPNYNYGYSIKQRSSEPGTKGLLVGEQVVYSR